MKQIYFDSTIVINMCDQKLTLLELALSKIFGKNDIGR